MSINNINSICSGSCDFEWSQSMTPAVNLIDTTDLRSIKITGLNFDPSPANNLVLIGSVACNVTATSTTQLTCMAGQNPIGTYTFSMSVANKGKAVLNTNPSVNFNLTTYSLTPAVSGTGGGLLLNVTGLGFSENCTVTVDQIKCPISFVSYSLISCMVPMNVSILFL